MTALAFGPDATTLAFATSRTGLSVWDIGRNAVIFALSTPALFTDLIITPSNELVAWQSAGRDSVRVWDLREAPVEVRSHVLSTAIRDSHARARSGLAYSDCGRSFAVSFGDLSLRESRIVFGTLGKGRQKYEKDLPGTVVDMALTPDGQCLAVGTWHEDLVVDVFDTDTGELTSQFHIESAPDRLELSPDGGLLAVWWSGTEWITVQLWDVVGGKCKTTLRASARALVSDVRFSPDGTKVITGAGDVLCTMVPGISKQYGEVRVWDVATAKNVETIELAQPVTRVVIAPNGRSVAAGCDDGVVKAWFDLLSTTAVERSGNGGWAPK